MPLASADEIDAVYHDAMAANTDRMKQQILFAWLATFSLDDIDASSLALAPALTEIVSKGQASSVSIALSYFAALMRGKGLSESSAFGINPDGFLGIAQDGFSVGLGGSTYAALVSKGAIGRGAPPELAGQQALRRVTQFATTELQDTGRAVIDMSQLLDERVVGYERTVNLPACGRCIVLAGKRYKKELNFDRHPQDDCGMRSVTNFDSPFNAEDNNPGVLLEKMTPTQRARALGGTANQEAYDAGADAANLIEAQRGMSAPGATYTTSGVTSRSLFAARNRAEGLTKQPGVRYKVSKASRLSPAGVREAAGGDQEKYRSLLVQNAYIL